MLNWSFLGCDPTRRKRGTPSEMRIRRLFVHCVYQRRLAKSPASRSKSRRPLNIHFKMRQVRKRPVAPSVLRFSGSPPRATLWPAFAIVPPAWSDAALYKCAFRCWRLEGGRRAVPLARLHLPPSFRTSRSCLPISASFVSALPKHAAFAILRTIDFTRASASAAGAAAAQTPPLPWTTASANAA